ncbi:MAG TPA: sulfotransferase [Anaerolineales bacterium]|nr:sulfotransferase [Anaerolineales bacterium]
MNMLVQPSPILVTGAHRTGTTWVGKMLSANSQAAYISEPLNVWHRPGVLRCCVKYWYLYIAEKNEYEYFSAFNELLRYRYHLFDEIKSLRSSKDLFRMGRDLGIFARGRLMHRRPLLKDPFAVFSLPWFVERLNCRAVVTIRHPAGFASSLKRLNWPFDFSDLWNQPLLMQDHLEPYREVMQAMKQDDIIGQASLLWTLVYRVVHSIRQRIPSIQIVRHEDLSLDPVSGYRALYQALGLDFTSQVERTILNSSSSENPTEVSRKKMHAVRLDSRANLGNWKRRLTSDEIARVRAVTEEVAHLYYPEVNWN